MDVQKLAARLKLHDERAFEEIIQRYTPLVSTIIYNIAGGRLQRQDVEEVVTDVFVTLWRNTDTLEPEKLHGYICCIAKSRAKDRLRKEKPIELVDISTVEEADDTVIALDCENKELCQDLKQEIRKIKEPDKEILIRYYYYYQSVSKIAAALQMNVETVKSKLQRTRQKLRTALINRGYEA